MQIKNLIVFIGFLFIGISSTIAQDKVQWITMDEMQIAMKNEPRKILIDVYTVWCGPCKMMMSQTFTNPEVIAYVNENFYAVKFNAEGNESITFLGTEYVNNDYNPANANRRNGTHEFTKTIAGVNGRIAYPTIVYFDTNYKLIAPVQGFYKPVQFLPLLHFINEELYSKGVEFNDEFINQFNENK